jgi:hypothetical protein
MAKGERFDAMTRVLGSGMSRRQAFKLAVGGALGTAGVLALQQRAADAACTQGVNCFGPSVCCPDTSFGAGTCAPPAFPQCCGTTSCGPAPSQQCCSGNLNGTQYTAPFCAPGSPATVTCCGPIACVASVTRCVATGPTAPCCLPLAAPPGSTCCGSVPNGCPPGTVCNTYPPGSFSCEPV